MDAGTDTVGTAAAGVGTARDPLLTTSFQATPDPGVGSWEVKPPELPVLQRWQVFSPRELFAQPASDVNFQS